MANALAATVYVLTNTINDHQYVGVTRRSVEDRWKQHLRTARVAPRTYLHRALAKYGPAAFTVAPIASCLDRESVGDTERAVIQQLAPVYNQTNGGEITIGRRVPRAVVERIKAANTGLKRTPEQNAANSAQAKARYASNPEYAAACVAQLKQVRALIDEDTRRLAVSNAARGRIWTEESRAKLSASCMGRRYGRDILDRMAEKHRKAVHCIELNWTFPSALEAAEQLGISNCNIGRVCAGKRTHAGGLRFRFYKED